jgi:predicted regulator of Ras-like GTPase activity (Roadblock/LC7/MglB family)
MTDLRQIVENMVEHVPGVVGVLLTDSDGLPVASSGEFDLDPYDLGAIVSACHQSYQILGQDLGQFWVESIMAEFDDLKLVQHRMPRGVLVVVAEKEAPLGVIRMEAKRSIYEITALMDRTAESRAKLLKKHQLRKPQGANNSENRARSLISILEKG